MSRSRHLKIYVPPSDDDKAASDAGCGRVALLLLVGASIAGAVWLFLDPLVTK